MRVAVLNGVNLDVLHRRDPALYGGLSLNQLETQIYEWAKELELLADCRQTNSEAEYVGWCHDAFDWAEETSVQYLGLYRELARGRLADRCFTQRF